MGRREDNKAATRARIVDVAITRFAVDGFTTVTIDDIARDAGISRRTFFHYFPTKEDVVLIDHDDQLARIIEQLRAQPPELSASAALWAVLEDLARAFDADRGIWLRHRLVVSEPAVHARHLQLQSTWDTQIAEVLADRLDGEDRAVRAQLVAATQLACLRSCALRCVTERGAGSLSDALVAARQVLYEEALGSRPQERPKGRTGGRRSRR